MFFRILLLLALATAAHPAHGQLFGPPKAKVVATPKPTPAPTAKPKPKRRTFVPKPTPDTQLPPVAPAPAEGSDLPKLAPGERPVGANEPVIETDATPPVPVAEAAPTPVVAVEPAAKLATARTMAKKPNAAATAFVPKVKALFAKRWADEAGPKMDEFSPGSLDVTFVLNADGNVTAFTVNQNTSNEAFARFCEAFVRATPFEKPPARALDGGVIEIPFTFAIY